MIDEVAILWTIRDRYGNDVYLTQERWQHIIEPINHPEMIDYGQHLQDTIHWGKRKQDSLNPQKYRYSMQFDDLCTGQILLEHMSFRIPVGVRNLVSAVVKISPYGRNDMPC